MEDSALWTCKRCGHRKGEHLYHLLECGSKGCACGGFARYDPIKDWDGYDYELDAEVKDLEAELE